MPVKVRIKAENSDEILKNYFLFFPKKLKIGILNIMTGSNWLKMGVGKSYGTAFICQLIDPDFSIDDVVYTPLETLKVFDKIESEGKLFRCVQIDEGEITAPAQLYHSFQNKMIFYNFATFRYLRNITFLLTPDFSWVDKRLRMLASHVGFFEKIYNYDKRNAEVILRLSRIMTNIYNDKIYITRTKLYVNGKKIYLKLIKTRKPDDNFIQEYEKKSIEFKKNLRKRLIPDIQKYEKVMCVEEKKSLTDLALEIIDNEEIRNSLLSKRGKLDRDLIHEKYNLTYAESIRLKKLVEKLMRGGKN